MSSLKCASIPAILERYRRNRYSDTEAKGEPVSLSKLTSVLGGRSDWIDLGFLPRSGGTHEAGLRTWQLPLSVREQGVVREVGLPGRSTNCGRWPEPGVFPWDIMSRALARTAGLCFLACS